MPEPDVSSASDTGVALSSLHHRSIAIQLVVLGCEQVFMGHGVYDQDSELGRVLRIELAVDAGYEFLIRENSWSGKIQSGRSLGCDFLIRLV
jgi:hypothetical protein